MFRKLFTWCLYGALMGLCILGFLGLFVAIADAQEVIPDVKARVIGTAFQCHVGITEPTGATAVPTASVSLFEEFSLILDSHCTDLAPGELDVHVEFQIGYRPNVVPNMHAMAWSEPNCKGLNSLSSVNGCRVRHTVPAPVVLTPAHEPVVATP